MAETGAGRWLQLVPPLGAPASGVFDFATLLQSALGGARTVEVEAEDDGDLPPPLAPRGAVLLHYVGYGYHPRGIPLGLARSWEAARRAAPGARFGVHFHEPWAFGPPWRSSFWLLPVQRAVARRLLVAADAAVTSLERYRRMLGRLAPGRQVAVLPMASTVGEPAPPRSWRERPARLVVFGSEGVRRRAWQGERLALAAAVRQLRVREVLDVGPGPVAPDSIAGVPVSRVGLLLASEVSALLGDARAGFLAYPPDFLDKSTIYGAYLAHGLLPLCAWSGPRGRAPRAGELWVRATRRGFEAPAATEALALRARRGYAERSVARHADLWRELLGPA